MKTIRNLIIVLTLTASMAFADGHTGGGGRCDTCTPPPCTENCNGFESVPESPDSEVYEGEVAAEDVSYTEYFTKIFVDFFSLS